MIVLKPRFSFDWLFSFAKVMLLLLTAGVAFLFYASDLHHNQGETPIARGFLENGISLNCILSGPLQLKEDDRSALALSLERKLVLLAQSVRPGFGKERRAFRIGVEGSNDQRVVREGEAIYCQVNLHPSGGAESVFFADSGGEYKLIPRLMDNRSLKLAVEQTGKEAFEILLKAGSGYRAGGTLPVAVEQLKGAKWWGQDCFFAQYGGEIFRQMGDKQKLEVGMQVLYVGAGDFLSLDGDQWRVCSSLEQTRSDAPLGLVEAIAPDQLEIEVWDERGFSLFQICLQREVVPSMTINLATLITEPKRRTTQGISCKIGGKRWILKAGDWILRTQMGWRKLQTEEEISAYLNHRLLGDLLLVDSLDQNGLLLGHVIDMRRTQAQPFSIQVAGASTKKGRSRR